MTNKDKDLLLKDLCARLPYGVICKGIYQGVDVIKGEFVNKEVSGPLTNIGYNYGTLGLMHECELSTIKPYLRPMSSMTIEEKQQSRWYRDDASSDNFILYMSRYVEWLDSKHFDWRSDGNGKTMIEKGLALEAPKGMYD